MKSANLSAIALLFALSLTLCACQSQPERKYIAVAETQRPLVYQSGDNVMVFGWERSGDRVIDLWRPAIVVRQDGDTVTVCARYGSEQRQVPVEHVRPRVERQNWRIK